jgi:hypothetical protein
MALLTIPEFPEKGTLQEYALNVTELFALVSEAYFTDQNNLKVINAIYKSKTSNQIELISFTPNGNSTLTSMAEFASTSRDEFELLNVVIVDQQNGRFRLKAAEIPDVANYDIGFSAAPPEVLARFSQSLKSSLMSVTNDDLTITHTTASGDFGNQGYLSNVLSSGKKYIEYVVTASASSLGSVRFGAKVSNTQPSNFNAQTYPFGAADGFSFSFDGTVFIGFSGGASLPFSKGSVVMMAIDVDAKKVWLGVNGSWGVGNDPATGTGGNSFSSMSGSNIYLGFSTNPGSNAQESATIRTSPSYLPSGFEVV